MRDRYSAKLLFQFRVREVPSKRRICEERIVQLHARNWESAIQESFELGAKSEYSYSNDDGHNVVFEFVGVVALCHLGPECDASELWYEIREHVEPMERKSSLVLSKSQLMKRHHKA